MLVLKGSNILFLLFTWALRFPFSTQQFLIISSSCELQISVCLFFLGKSFWSTSCIFLFGFLRCFCYILFLRYFHCCTMLFVFGKYWKNSCDSQYTAKSYAFLSWLVGFYLVVAWILVILNLYISVSKKGILLCCEI